MKSFPSGKPFFALLSFCVFFSLSVSVKAQYKDWRPVTPAELAEKSPIVEPDADAEAIFWEIRIDDSSDENLSMQHYVRVKIFTERGREKYSKFDIPFTKGLKIKDLAARVIKADGSIVEIGKDDIFDREIIKAGGIKIKAKSFAVPNIEPGVIVEYKYKEIRLYSGAKGMRLQFQREIPIQNLAYYYKPFSSREPQYQNYNFKDTKFVKDEKGFWLATRTNVPSFRDEPRMPPEDMVRPWMLLTGARIGSVSENAFGYTFTIKDPSSPLSYWGSVNLEQAPLLKFMTKSSSEISGAAKDIVATAASPDEKLRKIYEFCQGQIHNTSFDTTLTDEDRKKLPETKSINDVLKRKSGSSQFVDLLFGALANASGFETRIAFTGNRSEMFFNPNMTNDSLIHPAAIAVKVGEDWKYFNPGMALLPYGMLVWYEENTWALLSGDHTYMWRQTPMSDYDTSAAKRTGKFKLLEDGTLDGDVRVEYSGQPALTYRMENYDESANKREESLKDEIKARVSTAEITDIKIENLTDVSKPLVQAYKIRIPSYAQKTGKRLFLQPGFFEYGSEPVFSSTTRKYDVFFKYPWSETDKISFDLPPGFDLDNADSPGTFGDPQKIGLLDINIRIDKAKSQLLYDRQFHFGGGGVVLFPVASYPAVKRLFDEFQKSETHTITLRQSQ